MKEKRSVQFLMRLTPSEKRQWKNMAKAANLKTADLIRRQMAASNIYNTIPPINWKTYWTLTQISKTLIKLHRKINQEYQTEVFNSTTSLIEQLLPELSSVKLQLLGYQRKDSNLNNLDEDDWEDF